MCIKIASHEYLDQNLDWLDQLMNFWLCFAISMHLISWSYDIKELGDSNWLGPYIWIL